MKTFNPKACTLIIDGHTFQGFAGDSAVEMPMEQELVTSQTGADGKHMRTATAERGGEVKIHLWYNSESALHWERQITERFQEDAEAPEPLKGTFQDHDSGRTYSLEDGEVTMAPWGVTFSAGSVEARIFTFDFERIVPSVDGANGNGGE